jgi:hypothetical protein
MSESMYPSSYRRILREPFYDYEDELLPRRPYGRYRRIEPDYDYDDYEDFDDYDYRPRKSLRKKRRVVYEYE